MFICTFGNPTSQYIVSNTLNSNIFHVHANSIKHKKIALYQKRPFVNFIMKESQLLQFF